MKGKEEKRKGKAEGEVKPGDAIIDVDYTVEKEDPLVENEGENEGAADGKGGALARIPDKADGMQSNFDDAVHQAGGVLAGAGLTIAGMAATGAGWAFGNRQIA